MAKRINPAEHIGRVFGYITILEFTGRNERSQWLCRGRCACGVEKEWLFNALNLGRTRSCGCLSAEMTIARSTKHGLKGTRLYNIWKNMRQRCTNPNTPAYKNYGGRGIQICPEWNDAKVFYNWAMANGYSDDLSIERKDVNKGYNPQNCTWATRKEQNRNTRQNKYIKLFGETKTLADWIDDERVSVNRAAYYKRIEAGYSVERALLKPLRAHNRKEVK